MFARFYVLSKYARTLITPLAYVFNLLFGAIKLVRYFCEEHVVPSLLIHKGSNCIIEPTSSMRYAENIVLGKNVLINHYCMLWAGKKAKIIIGNDVLLGPSVKMFAANHGTHLGMTVREQNWDENDIRIGNDVWIGANSTILKGVSIVEGCVIGANSVVVKSIHKMGIYAGTPVKFLRLRK